MPFRIRLPGRFVAAAVAVLLAGLAGCAHPILPTMPPATSTPVPVTPSAITTATVLPLRSPTPQPTGPSGTPAPSPTGTSGTATPSTTVISDTPTPMPTAAGIATPVSTPNASGGSGSDLFGAAHPVVGGTCLELATRPVISIVEVPGAVQHLPAHTYQSVPLRRPVTGDFNLRPHDDGGAIALAVHSRPEEPESVPLNVNGPAYVDWSIVNDGPDAAPPSFAVDIYFDDTFVNRWQGIGLAAGGRAGISDWVELGSLVRIEPGVHTLRLVIDPVGALAEQDETDNVVEREFAWEGTPASTPRSTRLPDLRFTPAEGAATVLVASNHPAALASGGLSADYRTYLTWAVENHGLASTADSVFIHVFFDDQYVTTRIADGLTAGGRSSVLSWEGLTDTVAVTPGTHRVRLMVDAGDLIPEGDEENNTYEAELTWGTGDPNPVETNGEPGFTADRPVDSGFPNLRPEIPDGWAGPVVVHPAVTAEGAELPIAAGSDIKIDYAVWNGSPRSTGGTFQVEVQVDGRPAGTGRFKGSAGDAGAYWNGTVIVEAGRLSPGTHTVSLFIDSGRTVAETDEADNHCERSFRVDAAATAGPTPTVHSVASTGSLLAPLDSLLMEVEPLGGRTEDNAAVFDAIAGVAEAGYYDLFGASLADAPITVHLVPREEYVRLTLQACMARSETLPADGFDARLTSCANRARESGQEIRWNGRIHVFVDTSQAPAGVLDTLFHELGHARQAIIAPSPHGGATDTAARALHEAQAQIFEAAMWRRLEAATGKSLALYPDIPAMRDNVIKRLQQRVEGANQQEEHDLAYVLLWVIALDDPQGLGLSAHLRSTGRLDASDALHVYESLLAIDDAGATAWANPLLARASAAISEYRDVALSRLVAGLPGDQEGHPALRAAGLDAP